MGAPAPDDGGGGDESRKLAAAVEELRAAQETLRRSEEQFRAVAETAMDGIISADGRGRIVYTNRSVCRIFGYTTEELVGRPLSTLMPERFREAHQRGLARYMATGEARVIGRVLELAGLRQDGSEFPIELSVSSWQTAEGTFFTGLVRDITERKRTEAALAEAHRDLERKVEERTAELSRAVEREQAARADSDEANRLKDEFLATLSHELRTPLQAILGWAQMLRDGNLDDQTARRAVETIARNAKVQHQLISDILDVSRIIAGKLRLNVRMVSPATVVKAALETVRPAAEAKEIELRSVLDPDAGPVRGDPDRLQQVVWNLLANAIKFTPRGGQVRVAVRRVDSHVRIDVEDTGAGIEADFLPHAFERFRQGDSSSTRPHGGLGLGLAIVRHLVELHGGGVEAASAGKGRGATFTVKLPIGSLTAADSGLATAERHASTEEEDSPVVAADLGGIRVLVVDDDLDSRQLISAVLERQGAEVMTVGSVVEALGAVRASLPDVLLADIEMPAEDGYGLIRQVRALPAEEGGRTPAGALTASARSEDRMRALLAGFQIHLAKPARPAELIAVVASLAGRT